MDSMNETISFEEYHRNPYINALACLATLCIAMAAFFGNIAVILLNTWDENLKMHTGNILIIFLACIDVMTSIFVMLPSAVAIVLDYWPWGWIICRVNAVFNYMCACSSSHTAAMISLDRAVAVLFPMRYETMMTRRTMISLCAWITFNTGGCAVFCGATPWIAYDYFEGVCSLKYNENGPKIFIQCGATFCFWVPAIIIATCNFLILKRIRRSGQIMSVKFNVKELCVKRKKELDMRKSVYTMMAIVVVYYLSLTPYSISKQVKVVSGVDPPPWFNYLCTVFLFLASAANPFIYAILRKDYREGFKKVPRMIKEKFYNCCF